MGQLYQCSCLIMYVRKHTVSPTSPKVTKSQDVVASFVMTLLVKSKIGEKWSHKWGLTARETENIPLLKLTPIALDIERSDLTNRVTTSWLSVTFGEAECRRFIHPCPRVRVLTCFC